MRRPRASVGRSGVERGMSLASSIQAAEEVLASMRAHEMPLDRAALGIAEALRNGHKVLTCGNGGSAAQAAHLTTELVGRFHSSRRPLPALFLGGDASLITCIANDFSWDEVFSRPLQALAQAGDVVVCFSTSGNGKNLARALSTAQDLGLSSLALLGKGGGDARGRASWEIIIDSDDTARIQEAHLFLLHCLCERLEGA